MRRDKCFKKIDFIFFNEGRIRQAVLDARNDLITPEIRNGSGIPDPTAHAAIRNLTPLPSIKLGGDYLKFPESWLQVIDKTYNWCKRQSATHFQAVRRKYRGEHYQKICHELSISSKTFYNLTDRTRTYALLQAVQLRLLRVD